MDNFVFISKIFDNLFRDFITFLIPLLISFFSYRSIYTNINSEKKEKERDILNADRYDLSNNYGWALTIRKKINRAYSMFTGTASVYPLFGMLGTVISLLNLPTLADENKSIIEMNFLSALTSSFWGIILAVIAKWISSWLSYDIEKRIEDLDKIIALDKNKTSKGVPNESERD